MKQIFINKPANLEELKEELKHSPNLEPEDYRIAATSKINPTEWDSLTNGFLNDRDWLSFLSKNIEWESWCKHNCIEVSCKGQPFKLLIDTQGYDYARYVAIIEN